MMSPEYVSNHNGSLTPEQITALEAGPGVVHEPITELKTPEEVLTMLRPGYASLGNFHLYFESEESSAGHVYRRQPCRLRFAILYPELTQELETMVITQNLTTTQEPLDVGIDRRFIEAYDHMTKLVDRGDPSVLHEGTVDPYFLLG
jgi:hypothetical protein